MPSILEMTDEDFAEALVVPLSEGTNRALGRKPTEAEFHMLVHWAQSIRMQAVAIQGAIDRNFDVFWKADADDWAFSLHEPGEGA